MVLLVVSLVLGMSGTALAATAVNLGTAGNFAVLGGSTVTNTGSTVVNGDLGLSPGTSVTGFPPGTVIGTQHVTDAVAAQGQTDLVTAYNVASGQTSTQTVSGDLGGQTLTPGVYTSASSLGLTGTLTLDGQNNPNAVFIFQVGSALTTASASRVNLINGAQACNVFWQITSSATLGTNSNFVGTVLALTSVTATTGAVINGRILARNGAVTLDTNSVNRPTCATVVVTPTPSPSPTPTPVTLTPTPTSTPVVAPAVVSTPAPTPTLSMPIPGLPKTGVNPNSPNLPWQLPVFILGGFALLATFLKRKKMLSGK
jgi:Ice-binding-like